ncbi:hypothetical protein [Nonomuraea sp. B19D2]|uniref:hypothetical protein n=1 Tax=Nonomuraea sp. B19D2 TaxID=3159561 RepID=UPI0032DA48F9
MTLRRLRTRGSDPRKAPLRPRAGEGVAQYEAADGAAIVIKLATLGPGGPTGGFYDDGTVPW